jgi:release factor glutamine methyltransferase
MRNLKQYIRDLKESLEALYDADEASSIAKYYVQEKLVLSSTDLIVKGDDILHEAAYNILENDVKRLLSGEPVQYVTNSAWFCDNKYYVDKSVLIPRQETEILIREIVKSSEAKKNLKILDIGTGSGCIPISLKKAIQDANVYAVDISERVLEVATKNSSVNNVEIVYKQFDVLSGEKLPFVEKFDVIVSNPPYVTDSEKKLMHKNVTGFEPYMALYVRDEDPLLFYRNILIIAQEVLKEDGQIWFEINEKFPNQIIELCQKHGFKDNIVISDLNKKSRFVKSMR